MRDIKYIFSDGILSSKYRRPLLYWLVIYLICITPPINKVNSGLAVFGSLLYGYDGTYFTAVLKLVYAYVSFYIHYQS